MIAIRLIGLIGLVVLLALGAGCAKIKRARSVEHAGFVPQKLYAKMTPGEEGQVSQRWVKEGVNWASYDKIMLDPIQLWRGVGMEDVPSEDVQTLADNFYNLLYVSLSKDYEMVTKPQAGALRLQIALTRAEQSVVGLDTVSTLHPGSLAISGIKEYITEKPAFVGEAMVEAMVKDAKTRRLLAAGVDRRVGGKALDKEISSWNDVTNAMEWWSEMLRYRLCQVRKDTNCVPPEV